MLVLGVGRPPPWGLCARIAPHTYAPPSRSVSGALLTSGCSKSPEMGELRSAIDWAGACGGKGVIDIEWSVEHVGAVIRLIAWRYTSDINTSCGISVWCSAVVSLRNRMTTGTYVLHVRGPAVVQSCGQQASRHLSLIEMRPFHPRSAEHDHVSRHAGPARYEIR